jgi:hypothetical protein
MCIMPSETKLMPSHVVLDQLSCGPLKIEANSICNSFPVTQRGSASGKFAHQYEQYMFHKSSQESLIKKFVNLANKHLDHLSSIYEKVFTIEWIYLAHCRSPWEVMSIPHRDGHWMDGQIHLSIQGESNIEVWDKEESPWIDKNASSCNLSFPNGTLWYLHGSRYWHSIKTTECRMSRFELLAPVNPQFMNGYIDCLADPVSGIIDPTNKNWIKIKRDHIKYQKGSVGKSISSAPYSLNYIKGYDED